MRNHIGAVATIIWNNLDIEEELYFSFEELPAGAEADTYVLPLAQIRDDEVFMYCSEDEFLKWSAENVKTEDFSILDYILITPVCKA